MSAFIRSRALLPPPDTRKLLIKWVVGLLVPVLVFTFIWSGEAIINQVLVGFFTPGGNGFDTPTLVQAAIFIILFYAAVMALTGYLVAADSGRRGTIELWIDLAVFTLIPLLFVMSQGLILGLAICVVIWMLYFGVRRLVRRRIGYTPPPPLANLKVLDAEQRAGIMERAIRGGFWFAAIFAGIWLVVDLIFYFSGQLPTFLLIWVALRTLLLPVAGYFLGRLGGTLALRRTLAPKNNGNGETAVNGARKGK